MPLSRIVPAEPALAPWRSWKVNESLPLGETPLTVLTTFACPRALLVNVQVTVSPGSSLKDTVRVIRLTVLAIALAPSSQDSPDRSKLGVGSDSVDVYVPGARLGTVIEPPSPIVPAASPVNAKLP